MSKLYLMRHGQTLFNVLKRKQGWCDSPLTELGCEQARRAGAWFRDNGVAFDHVYTSTQERACDTCELVLEAAGVALPYTREKGLKEWNFGKFEALTEDTNPPLPYGDFYVPFGGEGEMQLRERLVSTLTEIMSRPGHESVLAVSHGAAVAQFLRALGPAQEEKLRGPAEARRRIGNCGIMVFSFDPETKAFDGLELINPNE